MAGISLWQTLKTSANSLLEKALNVAGRVFSSRNNPIVEFFLDYVCVFDDYREYKKPLLASVSSIAIGTGALTGKTSAGVAFSLVVILSWNVLGSSFLVKKVYKRKLNRLIESQTQHRLLVDKVEALKEIVLVKDSLKIWEIANSEQQLLSRIHFWQDTILPADVTRIREAAFESLEKISQIEEMEEVSEDEDGEMVLCSVIEAFKEIAFFSSDAEMKQKVKAVFERIQQEVFLPEAAYKLAVTFKEMIENNDFPEAFKFEIGQIFLRMYHESENDFDKTYIKKELDELIFTDADKLASEDNSSKFIYPKLFQKLCHREYGQRLTSQSLIRLNAPRSLTLKF